MPQRKPPTPEQLDEQIPLWPCWWCHSITFRQFTWDHGQIFCTGCWPDVTLGEFRIVTARISEWHRNRCYGTIDAGLVPKSQEALLLAKPKEKAQEQPGPEKLEEFKPTAQNIKLISLPRPKPNQ